MAVTPARPLPAEADARGAGPDCGYPTHDRLFSGTRAGSSIGPYARGERSRANACATLERPAEGRQAGGLWLDLGSASGMMAATGDFRSVFVSYSAAAGHIRANAIELGPVLILTQAEDAVFAFRRLGSELDGHRAFEGRPVHHPLRVLQRAASGTETRYTSPRRAPTSGLTVTLPVFPAGRMQQEDGLSFPVPPERAFVRAELLDDRVVPRSHVTKFPPGATPRAPQPSWMPGGCKPMTTGCGRGWRRRSRQAVRPARELSGTRYRSPPSGA